MVSKVLVGLVAATQASAAVLNQADNVLLRIRRNMIEARATDDDLSPGSPLYNCHANCGYAILEVQDNDSVCDDEVFEYDYENCLACAGEDNYDIWQYYGSELTSAAAACGYATTAATALETSVPTAEMGETTAAATSAAATSAAATSAAATSAAATTTSVAAASTAAATSAVATETAATTSTAAAVTSTAAATSAAVASGSSTASAVSGAASGTGSATTSSYTSVVTAGAASTRSVAVGFVGAVALGVVYALGF